MATKRLQFITIAAIVLATGFFCKNASEHSLRDSYSDSLFQKLFASAKSSIRHQLDSNEQREFRQVTCSDDYNHGIFVRLLDKSGDRGCVGFIRGVVSLEDAAGIAAVDAAFFDPRYPHIRPDELSSLELEITIIDKLVQINDYTDFRLGYDTVLVRQYGKCAIIQGQIAMERKYSRERYLESICAKAALERDAYKRNDIQIYKADTIFRKMKYSDIKIDK